MPGESCVSLHKHFVFSTLKACLRSNHIVDVCLFLSISDAYIEMKLVYISRNYSAYI
jgi:hypothetical protein